MRFITRDRIGDVAIGGALAAFPLLPAGPSYLGLDWPWALEAFFLGAAAVGLTLAGAHRLIGDSVSSGRGCSESVRLVRRGYVTWLIPGLAAALLGLLLRNPFDHVLLGIEAEGLISRLARPMNMATSPLYPVRVWLTYLEGGVAFWLVSAALRRTSRPRRRIGMAVRGCLLGLGLVSVVSIVQYFTRFNLLEYWVRANPGLTRSHATLDDPNALASFLVLGIGLALGVIWSARRGRVGWRRERWVLLVAALACGALVTTVSRAGWAALMIAGLVVMAGLPAWLVDGSRARTVRFAARAAAVLVAAAFVLWAVASLVSPKRSEVSLPDAPVEALMQTVDPHQSLDEVLKGRLLIWQAALQLASHHWVLGAGLGQFPPFYAGYPGSVGPENAHNYFLQVLAEGGVLSLAGLTLLLTVIALAVRRPFRAPGRRRSWLAVGLSIGVLAFVLTWLTGHPLLNLSNQLWLACVLAVGLAALDPIASVTPTRSRLGSWLLHGAWVPTVAFVTLLALVPRAMAAVDDDALTSHAAGVYAWEQAPASDAWSGETAFRWTKGRAALREPIHGAVLTVPMYVARPDIPAQPVTLRVTVNGVPVEPLPLAANGWRLLSYDLRDLLGEERWRSQRTVTLEFVVTPTVVPARVGPSSDTRELGIGLGVVHWTSPGGESGPS